MNNDNRTNTVSLVLTVEKLLDEIKDRIDEFEKFIEIFKDEYLSKNEKLMLEQGKKILDKGFDETEKELTRKAKKMFSILDDKSKQELKEMLRDIFGENNEKKN